MDQIAIRLELARLDWPRARKSLEWRLRLRPIRFPPLDSCSPTLEPALETRGGSTNPLETEASHSGRDMTQHNWTDPAPDKSELGAASCEPTCSRLLRGRHLNSALMVQQVRTGGERCLTGSRAAQPTATQTLAHAPAEALAGACQAGLQAGSEE